MNLNTDITKYLKEIKKTSLHELIVSQIQDLIEGEKLKVGDKLPTEREFAAAFRVSRHTVREAFRALENMNIIKSRVGSGTFVVFNKEQELNDVLVKYVVKERDKISEVFQLRLLIEPQIAFLAAENATDIDIIALEKIVLEQESLTNEGDSGQWVELDNEFHLTIARATGNSLLARVVELIMGLLNVCRAEVYQTRERIESSTEKHREIVRAISNRAPDETAKIMTDHVNYVEKIVKANIEI